MRRIIGGILMSALFLCTSITSQANSLSYIPTEVVEGISPEVQQYAVIIGNEFNICPELLMAIAYQESRCTADATNGTCMGLMQVNTKIHEERFIEAGWSPNDWDDAYKSMYVAASYLSDLFEKYEDVGVVLTVYHGEKNGVYKAQHGQLSSYVQSILDRSEALEREHGK